MRNVLFSLIISTLVACGSIVVFAQEQQETSKPVVEIPDGPPPNKSESTRVVGIAKAVYLPSTDRTQALLPIQLSSNKGELFSNEADGTFYTKVDNVDLLVGFDSAGNKVLVPQQIKFAVFIGYAKNTRLRDDHRLIISVDGKQLLSGELAFDKSISQPYDPRLGTSLSFAGLSYPDLQKLSIAKTIAIQIGPINFDLSPQQVHGFKDLNSLIQR